MQGGHLRLNSCEFSIFMSYFHLCFMYESPDRITAAHQLSRHYHLLEILLKCHLTVKSMEGVRNMYCTAQKLFLDREDLKKSNQEDPSYDTIVFWSRLWAFSLSPRERQRGLDAHNLWVLADTFCWELPWTVPSLKGIQNHRAHCNSPMIFLLNSWVLKNGICSLLNTLGLYSCIALKSYLHP